MLEAEKGRMEGLGSFADILRRACFLSSFFRLFVITTSYYTENADHHHSETSCHR
jgi:hypothetical protein